MKNKSVIEFGYIPKAKVGTAIAIGTKEPTPKTVIFECDQFILTTDTASVTLDLKDPEVLKKFNKIIVNGVDFVKENKKLMMPTITAQVKLAEKVQEWAKQYPHITTPSPLDVISYLQTRELLDEEAIYKFLKEGEQNGA